MAPSIVLKNNSSEGEGERPLEKSTILAQASLKPPSEQSSETEQISAALKDKKIHLILAVLASPAEFNLIADENLNRKDIEMAWGGRIGRTTMATKITQLAELELIEISPSNRIGLTELGQQCVTSLSQKISEVLRNRAAAPPVNEEEKKVQHAHAMLNRSSISRNILTKAIEVAQVDAHGEARVNPIAIGLALKPKQVRAQLAVLRNAGLLGHNNEPTELATMWLQSQEKERQTDKSPAARRKDVQAAGANESAAIKVTPAKGLRVREPRVISTKKGTTGEAPSPVTEVAKKSSVSTAERPSAPASKGNKPVETAKVTLPPEAPVPNPAVTPLQSPAPVTIPASIPVPVEPQQPSGTFIANVRRQMSDVQKLINGLEDLIIRPEDKERLLKMPALAALELLETAKVLGRVNHAATSAPSSLVREKPHISLSGDELQVTFQGLQMVVRSFLSFLERTRASLPDSRKAEKTIAQGKPASRETINIIEALKDPLLGMDSGKSALLARLVPLRNKLEILAYPENHPYLDFQKDPEALARHKDLFRQEFLSPYGVISESELRKFANRPEDNLVNSAARATLTLMQADAAGIVDAITAIERFGTTSDSIEMLRETQQLRHIVHSYGLPLASLNSYDRLTKEPVHTSLPPFTGPAATNEKFFFEMPEYPGISLTVTRDAGQILHRISGLNISSHPEIEAVLSIIRRFETAQMNMWSSSTGITAREMPSSLTFPNGIEISREFKVPSTASGEVWITDGSLGEQNELKNPTYLMKIRFRDYSRSLEIVEMMAAPTSRTLVRAMAAEVLHSNKTITSQLIGSASQLKLSYIHDQNGAGVPADRIEDVVKKRDSDWIAALVDQLEQNRATETYFVNLANHPVPARSGSLLKNAMNFDLWEQNLIGLHASTPLQLDSLSIDQRGLTVSFKGASKLPLDQLLEAPPASITTTPHRQPHREASVPAADMSQLMSALTQDLSVRTGSGIAVPELANIFRNIHFLKGSGRLDRLNATFQGQQIAKQLLMAGEISGAASGVLLALETENNLTAIDALRVFGPRATPENVRLLSDLQKIRDQLGFVNAPFESCNARGLLLNPKFHITTSALIRPEAEHFNIVIVDAPAVFNPNMNRESLIDNASYAIRVKWGFPKNALAPIITAIHVRSDCDIRALQRDLINIHRKKLELLDNFDNSLESGLSYCMTASSSSGQQHALRPGYHFSDRFTGLDAHKQALWLTDGRISIEESKGSERLFSTKDESFELFITRAPYSKIALIRRLYLKDQKNPSVTETNARTIVRNVLEYNLREVEMTLGRQENS